MANRFVLRQHVRFAWHGSGRRWDAGWMAVIGGLIGGFAIWFLGIKVPQTILDNPLWGGVVAIILGAIVGVVFVFIVRLCWAPFHFRLEPLGGLQKALRAALGDNMWPVILMLSGIACFALLFGAGMLMFAMNQSKAHTTTVTCKAANSEYNVTKKLRAIDEIYAQLAGPLTDLQNEAGMILNSFNSRVVNSTAIPDLLTYHGRSQTVFQKYFQTMQSYDYLRDIYDVMIHEPSNFSYSSTEQASEDLAHELQRLHAQIPDGVLQNVQNSRQMSAWESVTWPPFGRTLKRLRSEQT
jgi:uncharacterized protein YfkK (UPF0435 family)